MKSKVLMALLCLSVLMFTSCRSNKDYLYLQDVVEGKGYPYNYHEPKVHAGDKLNIIVSCKNPELAIPFNSNGGVIQVSSTGAMLENNVQTRSTSYKVDQNGDIEFPILGTLHLEGLTASEVQDLIKNRIVEGKYINNPLVSMEFLNFKYVVIGATGVGTFTSDDGRVNLIQAIANAGDLAANANTKHVKVLREVNGELVMKEHDLTKSDFMMSDYYYLQQNDVIYVEPKYKQRNFGDYAFQYASFALSIASVIISYMWVTK